MTPSGGLAASISCIASRMIICVIITGRSRCVVITISANKPRAGSSSSPTRRADLAHAVRPQLYHHSDPVPPLALQPADGGAEPDVRRRWLPAPGPVQLVRRASQPSPGDQELEHGTVRSVAGHCRGAEHLSGSAMYLVAV